MTPERDRAAQVALLVAAALAAAGRHLVTADLPPESAPDAAFAVDGDADGEPLRSGSVSTLAYEDRWFLLDRTVHGTA